MKVPPLNVYKTFSKSDLSTEDAKRLVDIIKRVPTDQGIAIFKSLRWSFSRAMNSRRFLQVEH